jgi:hypothetical protein
MTMAMMGGMETEGGAQTFHVPFALIDDKAVATMGLLALA